MEGLYKILKDVLARVKEDKEYSDNLLEKTGIYDKDGKLSEHYREDTISSLSIK